MSKMIEIVATAMFLSEMAHVGKLESIEKSWNIPGHADLWRARAKAALWALHDPNEKMVTAGMYALKNSIDHFDGDRAVLSWQAMVEEALR